MMRAVILMCLAASLASSSAMKEGKVIRKQARRPGTNDGSCKLSGPEFYFTMIGEHTSPTGAFLVPDPTFPHHRTAGYTNEELDAHWEAASEFYLKYAGVDFTDVPVGEDGMKHLDGWSIIPFVVNFGLRVP